ncbi:hypothetical protein DOY81_015414, partial [Sarcophaga bullata]
IYDSTINNWMNHRLIRAMQFSPKLVLDCSYDDYMTKREAENAAKQLMLCFAENRFHDDPFDLHYCNVNNEPLSLAKAKRLGLRMARLPLDRYLQWGAGSGKSLTLNQMINILLDLKTTGDWMRSLRHVPRRKVIDLKRDSDKRFRHANRVNIRIDQLLNADKESMQSNNNKQIRSYKDMQFNISTWGSKRKERQ